MGLRSTSHLSFAQERLWFLEQWEPGSTAYLLSYAWQLRGPLNRPALDAALTVLVARHESLRTAFGLVDEDPVPMIMPPTPVALSFLDLADLPEIRREEEVRRFIQEEALRPFDLTISPLWRGQLLRVSSHEHIFLFTIHHLITDGWSMGILFEELNTLYAGQVDGAPVTLPALPLQYTDYAVRQRKGLNGEALDRQNAYWRAQLAGAPQRLELPTDFPRSPQTSYRGNSVSHTLSPSLTQALNSFSRQEGVTLFMTMLAAFQTLLYRYTGQEDILLGCPIAGRTHLEFERIVGFFANTLVLRTRFDGRPTFHELLHQVKKTCLNAYTHQDLPFEKLVEMLQPVRDPGCHPVFQVMFQLQHADATNELNLQNLKIFPLARDRQTAKFDLSLELIFRNDTLHSTFIFNADLFENRRIQCLASHFRVLLEGLVHNPMCPVSRLPLLLETERRQLLTEWNPPVVRSEAYPSIHALFEAQAARTPDAVAVVDGEAHLTYRSLHSLANQLAHFLHRHGVGPEVMVGLYMDKSQELLIGLLGILKAGGAYVPLDPHSPVDRIAHMIDQANPSIILLRDRSSIRHVFPDSCQTVYMDELLHDCMKPAVHNCSVPVAPNMMAYMIFTSGSTGSPKGIVVSHANLLNAFQAWEQTYHLRTRCTRHLQMAHMVFDVFTGDVVRVFGSGGTLILCPRETLLDPQKLYDLLRTERVVCAEFVPGVMKYLLDYAEDTHKTLSFFHLFIVGSDVCEITDFRRLRQVCGEGTRLMNSYGLTEATIDSAFFEDLNGRLPQTGSVPIGRPMPNTHLFVLDGERQPVPVGVTGEVHVAGEGLARGYWRRPDLTAERFLPHPASQEPGDRIYRTGDFGSYDPDGNLHLRGRADHQVKIRGFRVELRDIEAVLQQHPAVHEAVVLCPENEHSEDNQLVAYVVGQQPHLPLPNALREYLREKLPAYMVPTGIISLDTLPRLPSGKINRNFLLYPPPVLPTNTMEGRTPETPVEESLVGIWKELLNLPVVNVRDNFFELGGHSLLATRLLAKLRGTWQSDFPLRILFDHPVLEDQAVVLEEHLLKEIEELSEEDLENMLKGQNSA